MAIQKVWSIDHRCGHSTERDLSDRKPDKRAGFAKWLASTDCVECFKKSKRAEFEKQRAAERLEKQKRELADAEVYEQRSGLEGLSGSEKQIAWARTIRVQVLGSLYEQVEGGQKGEDWFERTILVPARLIATSRWWIDNKDFGVEDWPELLAAGAESTDANENLSS